MFHLFLFSKIGKKVSMLVGFVLPDDETDSFADDATVLQSDILAPFLFILVIDYFQRIYLDKVEENVIFLKQRQSIR